jgi:drug/metabolite transporter (DMT)-like permease
MKAVNMIMDEHVGEDYDQHPSQLAKLVAESAAKRTNQGGEAATDYALGFDLLEKTVSASFLTTLRFAIALVLLAIFLPRLFLGNTAAHWRMGIWTGLVFAPGFIMQNVGLNYVPASRSGFLTSLSVVFTPLVLIVLERRLPRWLVLAGVVIGLVGTSILTGLIRIEGPLSLHVPADAFSQFGAGDWLTIAAALIFTIQILLIDRFSRHMPAGRLTVGMFVATLAVGVTLFAIGNCFSSNGDNWPVWNGLVVDIRFLALVTVMSVLCTVLAFHWMNKYQGHVTPAQAALIYTTEPIFATVWAMVLPDIFSPICGIAYASERPGSELLIGGLFIVMGNALALWPERRPDRPSSTLATQGSASSQIATLT